MKMWAALSNSRRGRALLTEVMFGLRVVQERLEIVATSISQVALQVEKGRAALLSWLREVLVSHLGAFRFRPVHLPMPVPVKSVSLSVKARISEEEICFS